MGLFSKQKNCKMSSEYCVIKIFKTIKQSDEINIKPCFEAMLGIFTSRGYSLTEIDINYGTKKWKKISSFYKFIETHKVVEFSASFNLKNGDGLDPTGITYSNHLSNLTRNTDEKDFINFTVAIPYDWYSLNLVKAVVKEIDIALKVTYAYVCFLPRNYSAYTERLIKTSFFSVSIDGNKEDIELRNNLKNADCGYIPKKYPVNFYNSKQLASVEGNMDLLEKISENLTLVTYTV